MSHVAHIDLHINDLADVKAMCKELGWEFREGQKTYEWYGKWENDYNGEDAAYHHGFKPEDYGKCSHAIRIPGCSYEIGLVEIEKGKFKPIWDFWKAGGLKPHHISDMKQTYTKHWVTKRAKKRGWRVTHKKVGKEVKLYLER